MRISLKFIERFGINHLLNSAEQASLAEWKAIDTMKQLLVFRADEIKKFKIRPDQNGGIIYDKKAVEGETEFTLPDTGFVWLRKTLSILNERGALHRDLISLAQKVFAGPKAEKRTTVSKEPKPKRRS